MLHACVCEEIHFVSRLCHALSDRNALEAARKCRRPDPLEHKAWRRLETTNQKVEVTPLLHRREIGKCLWMIADGASLE